MEPKYIGKPLTKDVTNRKLSGVCAGIAKHYNLPVFGVRAATVMFGLMFPPAAVFAYLLATFLMPVKHY